MLMATTIPVTRKQLQSPKAKPRDEELGFGRYFTDQTCSRRMLLPTKAGIILGCAVWAINARTLSRSVALQSGNF